MSSVTPPAASIPSGAEPGGTRRHAGGRRAGSDSTRQSILEAAVKLFAERGYAASSLRAITSEAGVDVAMVKHFFGDKQGLFDEAILQHADRMESALNLDDVPLQEFPDRFAEVFLQLWEKEPTASTFIALIRAALESPDNRDHLESALQKRLIPVMHRLLRPSPDGSSAPAGSSAAGDQHPTQLLGAHLLGLGIARYILRLAPIADLPREVMAREVAETVRRYLVNDE